MQDRLSRVLISVSLGSLTVREEMDFSGTASDSPSVCIESSRSLNDAVMRNPDRLGPSQYDKHSLFLIEDYKGL